MNYKIRKSITQASHITEINDNIIKSIIFKSESYDSMKKAEKENLFVLYSKRFQQKISQKTLEKLVPIYSELGEAYVNMISVKGLKHLPSIASEKLDRLYKEKGLTKIRKDIQEEFSKLIVRLKADLSTKDSSLEVIQKVEN